MLHPRSPFSVSVVTLFLAAALPSVARADSASSRALDPAQLDAFAALVGEPTSTVAGRIATEPSLLSLAAKAADARTRRKHTGIVLTITGVTIFGVGSLIGWELMVAGLRPSNCPNGGCESSGNRGVPGLVVALVSEAIGLGLAIPGIVKIAKQSDAESEASAWYFNPAATSDGSATSARPARSVGVGVPEPSMRPTGFSLPLLSGTF